MKLAHLLSISMLLALSSTVSAAVDLKILERKIVKEPVYRTKPKYCLLVFGPEAKTHIWLVQDGDTLYVDRNGNGDLTEADEKVTADKQENAGDEASTFKAGDLRDGKRLHKDLTLTVMKIDYLAERYDAVKELLKKAPKARGYALNLEVEMPGRKGISTGGRVYQLSFIDSTGVLQFAERPQDAPILHFGGPLQVTLFGKEQLTIDREKDVVLGFGSAGVGPGSFTWTIYENVVPKDIFPTLDIVYPPKHPGEAPLREHYELKQRC
ncbi:MAG TPA: hypothetical protein VE999_18650 [Gemmataceae bacterium]|nr:hypothetical protein [Gemmataceae bacterium]